MDTKLTLKLDQQVIEKAKIYAKSRKTSVSKLIQNYLQHITEKSPKQEDDISPIVKSLSGIIKLPKNHDAKKEYGEHLTKKYK